MKIFPVPNRLELRSPPLIGLAYLAGALAGGLAGAAGLELEAALLEGARLGSAALFLQSVAFIGLGCLVAELIFASPLLLLHRVRQWRYLTRSTAALLGLAIGAAPMLIILSRPLADGTSEMLGYFSNGDLTPSGYWRLLRGAAWSGSIGFASAATLAWIAVGHRGTGPSD